LEGALVREAFTSRPATSNPASHANKERDASLAEKVFWAVLDHLQSLQPAFARGNRGKGVARRFRRVTHVARPITWNGAPPVSPTFTAAAGLSKLSSSKSSRPCNWPIFLGHSANAVRWQVWTALLVYVLLRFLAFVHGWCHSFTRLFTLVRTAPWRRWDLASLLKPYGTASGDFRIIAAPQQPSF